MPTLFKVLIVLGVLAGVGFGVMTAMVSYLAPVPRDISQPITLPTPK